MTAPQNFRTAFNGFHREDVVHYIEFLNARHENTCKALQAELDQLQLDAQLVQQGKEALEELAQCREECRKLQEQLADREEAIRELEDRCNMLEGNYPADADQDARCASLEQELREVSAALTQAEGELLVLRTASLANPSSELEAYRRAERTERVAKERAEQVYRRANGALADATVKVDEAFARIGGLADQVSQQLAQLQEAVIGSRQALADAAGTLYTIRPSGEGK